MKTLLIGINAKFIHSNPAIRSICYYAQQRGISNIDFREFTINQYPDFILSQIYQEQPDVIGFSCYIWNYEMIKQLIPELKKVLPNCVIFLGGPEVSFESEQALQESGADIVVVGEGEETCYQLIQALQKKASLELIPGLVYDQHGELKNTPSALPMELDAIPFLYHDLKELEHRILYFEATRGCPFQCQYCLSGDHQSVRFMSLDKVYQALDFFLEHRVRQVKFVDRTFNCDPHYALSIWNYLHEHDNGYTNFHFEIAAELLQEQTLSFLSTVRKGQFQFEIGVQSTYPPTLRAIHRFTDYEKLEQVVKQIQQANNIHLHLDLIAGLPFEGYQRFAQSFCDVYALHPDQLQLGFLKLLKGSGLYRDAQTYGIVANSRAPYEVLYTNHLSYDEILRLKQIEHMVETYYNSNRFQLTIPFLISFFSSPFTMFEALADFYVLQGHHLRSHSNLEYYTILFQFFQTLEPETEQQELLQWYVKFDLYSHEKARKLPNWLQVSLLEQYRERIYHFFEAEEHIQAYLPEYSGMQAKQIYRAAHIEVFPFDPITQKPEVTAVLYNYKHCDLLGNAQYQIILLEE